MKCILFMFDSLNRRFLPPYGNDWVQAPNFKRLAQRSVTFDTSYIGSMPCLPARREWHTSRPNFLHRSWGPIEPFDDSVPQILKDRNVYTHLCTDHYHYWEDGGGTIPGRYNTCDFHRGQEGDPWIGQVADPVVPPSPSSGYRSLGKAHWRQDWVNRGHMKFEEQMPQTRTIRAGVEFLQRNAEQDNWLLQLETFDPHEPFFVPNKYRDLYPREFNGPHFDWPPYDRVTQSPEEVLNLQRTYAALVSMCDASLGMVLDTMDELSMWDDTMLIVCTDHGYLLGEHGWWAKMVMPWYEELARTPFFVWDPRCKKAGERRKSIVQPMMDLGPTVLEFFGVEPTPDMLGKSLKETIENDTPAREYALFGAFGQPAYISDGRHVYARGVVPELNDRLFRYWLMPTNMRAPFTPEECRGATLAGPFRFTKGLQLLRTMNPISWGPKGEDLKTKLYDLAADPKQEKPVRDEAIEQRMLTAMIQMMVQADAPADAFIRLGITPPQGLSVYACDAAGVPPKSDAIMDCRHMDRKASE
jgi:arylsulfatase A-like enzyme